VNAAACSQTGCSGLAPAPELCPCGAPAAATSPCRAFVNKPQPLFPTLTLISFLLNLTHTTREVRGRGTFWACEPWSVTQRGSSGSLLPGG
jgi:hypothetical protein